MSATAAMGQYRQSDVYGQLYDSEPVAAMRRHVQELSAAFMEGRMAGSQGEKDAADYVTAGTDDDGLYKAFVHLGFIEE